MADRVALIGGTELGRDHFPIPVPDSPSVPANFSTYPFSVDLEKMLKWVLRVKRWKFDCTVGYLDFGTPRTTTVEFNFRMPLNADDIVNPATREAELVLFEGGILLMDWTVSFADDGSGIIATYPHAEITNYSVTGAVLDLIFSFELSLAPLWVTGDEQFTNWVRLSCFVGGGAGEEVRSHNANPGVYTNTINSTGFTMDEETAGFVSPGPTVDVEVTAFTCDISPADSDGYWPYATTEGDLVYDADSGEELADPFS